MVVAMTLNDNNAMGGGAGTSNGAHATTQPNNSFTVKAGLAQMLKGGVIMDVVNAEQVQEPPLPIAIMWQLTAVDASQSQQR